MTTSHHSFPFLRLPWLAQESILKWMYVEDQFNLSKASTAAKHLLKFFSQSQKYQLQLDFFNHGYNFNLENPKTKRILDIYNSSKMVNFVWKENGWTYQKCCTRELIELIDHIAKIFNCSKISLNFLEASQALPVINLVKKLNIKVEDFLFQGVTYFFDADLFKWILTEYKNASNTTLLIEPPRNFEFPDAPEFNWSSVKISYSAWVTADILTRCFKNCESIELSHNIIPFVDFYIFIKDWLNGRLKVKDLKIETSLCCQDLPVELILRDLEYVIIQSVVPGKDRIRLFGEGYVIKNKNGQEAVVCWDSSMFVLSTCFEEYYPFLGDEYEEIGVFE